MNKKHNRVYTLILETVVLPAAVGQTTFQINNENRTCLLKSVTWSLLLVNNAAPFQRIPPEINTTQIYSFALITPVVGIPFAQIFETFAGPGVIMANGDQINFWTPGQVIFDSFYIRNNLNFIWTHENRELLITTISEITVIVEIEDIDFI